MGKLLEKALAAAGHTRAVTGPVGAAEILELAELVSSLASGAISSAQFALALGAKTKNPASACQTLLIAAMRRLHACGYQFFRRPSGTGADR